MLKSCPQCGCEFKTYRSAAIYCGRECQNASQVKRDTYTCGHCGEDFQRPKGDIKKPAAVRYCDRKCHAAAKRAAARELTCPTCGKTHKPGSANVVAYCSWECRNAGLVRRVILTCRQCDQPFERHLSQRDRSSFCSWACYQTHNVGPNHLNYKGGRWLKHGRRWDEIRAAIIARDKVCQWPECGVERSGGGRALDVHHIDPRRNYSIVDLANDPENLIALCRSHHARTEMWIKHGRTAELPMRLHPPA